LLACRATVRYWYGRGLLKRTCYSHAPLGKSANWPLDWHCPRALGLLGRTSRRLQCPEARHIGHSAADVTYLFVPFLSGPELPQLEQHAMENIVDLLQSTPGCYDGAALPLPGLAASPGSVASLGASLAQEQQEGRLGSLEGRLLLLALQLLRLPRLASAAPTWFRGSTRTSGSDALRVALVRSCARSVLMQRPSSSRALAPAPTPSAGVPSKVRGR